MCWRIVHLILIVLLGLIVYSNTFDVPFQFDDVFMIAKSPAAKTLEHSLFLMRQVGYVTFAVNYRLHGLEVFGYHVVNLLIHLITAGLVYWLLELTFRTPLMERSSLKGKAGQIALLSGLLFVCHPVQTQAVTYIVQRFASLAAMFYLASIVFYVKCRLSAYSLRALVYYVLSMGFVVLAMKTKETAFTLPLAIVMYELVFFREGTRRRFIYLGPLFLTMIIIPLTFISLNLSPSAVFERVSEVTRVHTEMSRAEYLYTEFSVIATYVRLLFIPAGQNLDYDYPVYSSFFEPRVLLSFGFLLLIFGLGVYMLRRSDRDAGGRLVAFGIFWFFLTLSVESSIIPIVDVINEHRLYLPSVGAVSAFVCGAFLLMERSSGALAGRAATAAAVLAVLVLSGATYARNETWRSETGLWQDVVRKSPMKARGHNNLGNSFLMSGDLEKAIKEYESVLRLDPKHREAHYNLGNAYYRMLRLDKAIENFKIAVTRLPKSAVVHFDLAEAYKSSGQIDNAMEHYIEAIRLKSDYPEAHYGLGTVYYWKDDLQEARREFETVLKLQPDNIAARQFLDEYLNE